jgi:hypothetical protein
MANTLSSSQLREVIEALEAENGNGSDGGAPALQLVQLRRENEELRDELAAIRNSIQMNSLIPLLTGNRLRTTNEVQDDDGDVIAVGTRFDFEPADQLSTLLPLLLTGGMGGDSSDNQNMLLLVLALTQFSGD